MQEKTLGVYNIRKYVVKSGLCLVQSGLSVKLKKFVW